jgi:hypothetical protein
MAGLFPKSSIRKFEYTPTFLVENSINEKISDKVNNKFAFSNKSKIKKNPISQNLWLIGFFFLCLLLLFYFL